MKILNRKSKDGRKNKFIYDFSIDHYKGFLGKFLYKVLNTIVKIGRLDERKSLKILDFGCGLKKLKPLINNYYIGYDINPEFTEIKDWRKTDFDIVVANSVFMYMTRKELKKFIAELHKKNPNVKLIFGVSKMNMLTKILKIVTGSTKSCADVKMSYKEQLSVLTEYFEIIDKKAIFGLNDVYLMKFK